MPLWESIADLAANPLLVKRRRYGILEVRDGALAAVHFRPWPKWASWLEIAWGRTRRTMLPGDRLWLYYNQPLFCPNFLTLAYAVSTRECSMASLNAASYALDEVARLKQSSALLCEAASSRFTERFLARHGWERHLLHSRRRHYIKRFCDSETVGQAWA